MDTRADTRQNDDELADYLASLDRDTCYRVDAVLKDGRLERTELVYFVGENGAELGPFVRKYLDAETGLGRAYQALFDVQRRGARLVHLPRVIECHWRDGRFVVVMEYVKGETLAACAGRLGDASARLDLVRRAFPDLCDAVGELHERFDPPIIHRDLTPSNVMVSLPEGRGPAAVTLIDLGIARRFREGAEHDTTHFGTRAYAPPEQFGFGQTDVTSDVYALGMLLFFCLTGREPTPADREARFAVPDVPEAFRKVIVCATELDPTRRYASARALRDAVTQALAQDTGSATEEGTHGEKNLTQRPVMPTPPFEPPIFDEPHAPHGLRGAVAQLLARVPRWLGAVWDVVVVGVTAVFVIGCVMAVVDPTPENASWPLWYLVLSYLCCALMFLVGGYLLLDRRPLRREIPALARLTVARETRVGLLAICALVAFWIVVSLAVQPTF
ncbi:serine/threonine protein kinase [Olsenella profusa]|uniref:non-specific serine/threonine protein kinase n=1 Tax=Olsenella profusa TaxID=138595 RepID=A0ABS2F2H0_9ACTN|nr:protein kinase [Olsenella profusa]MBM6775184.1 protein kinase [Olsenella profusa]